MSQIRLIDAFADLKEFKKIDRNTMLGIVEDVFRNVIKKHNGTDENIDIIMNVDKEDIEIWANKIIVPDGELNDPALEIEYSKAILIEDDFEIGEEVAIEIKIEDFQRRHIANIRQNLISKIMEYEKGNIYLTYKDKIGELVVGEVYQIWKKELLLKDDNGIEMILPKQNMIPKDFYKKGDTLRAVVTEVKSINNTPYITISRTAPEFMERLFELEIPEIADGLIIIKDIVRSPGERAKVAVESYDERVDPVGACVGVKGSRIHGIVRELKNENIDIINYTENIKLYIQRSLSPARLQKIELKEEELADGRIKKIAEVFLDPEEVSKAIGRGGQNIKLASLLTKYDIQVFRDDKEIEEDIDLREFDDEIEPWIINQLKSIGLHTAKEVLSKDFDYLCDKADLEEQTVMDILRILRSEFK